MKSFLKNSRATAAIEFAIVAPMLILLLLGITEFGLTMFFDSSLNLGIRTVARQGIAEGYNDPAEMYGYMNTNLGGLYNSNPADTTFIVRTYNDFTNMTAAREQFQGDPASFFPPAPATPSLPPRLCPPGIPSNNACQSGQIVLYGVKYKWGGITGIMQPFLPDYLYSFSIVRNETFD